MEFKVSQGEGCSRMKPPIVKVWREEVGVLGIFTPRFLENTDTHPTVAGNRISRKSA